MSERHELIQQVRAELRRLGDVGVRESIDRFFTIEQRPISYGVASPALKRIAQEIHPKVKLLPVAERGRLCVDLWEGGTNEEGALVCYVYRRFAKTCGPREFRTFTRWLDRYVKNWGHTDGLSLWLLGASIANEPSLIGELDAWTRSKNRWKRRAAAVSLVPSARRGLHTREIFRIAAPLIQHPADVMRFLMPRRAQASRIVLRYAAEKMTAADRERLLAQV